MKTFSERNADTVNTPAGFKPVAGSLPVQFCLAQRDPDMNQPTELKEERPPDLLSVWMIRWKFYAPGGLDQWDPPGTSIYGYTYIW